MRCCDLLPQQAIKYGLSGAVDLAEVTDTLIHQLVGACVVSKATM